VRPERIRLEYQPEIAPLDRDVDAGGAVEQDRIADRDPASPATARSSVVLPLPDAPRSATTSPRSSVIETPLRIGLSPYCRCMSSTTSL
jgi:hypothetical protein